MTNSILKLITIIDNHINQLLNAIMHHNQFQQIESSWRGLNMLLKDSVPNQTVQIKILDLSFKELQQDLVTAIEFEQSQLFHKINTNEFDQPGGQPFGLLIGDYYLHHQTHAHTTLLEQLAKIAAYAFVPCVLGADASLFGIDEFTQIRSTMDLHSYFQNDEYQRWHRLRRLFESRFIGLVLPRILLRRPYNQQGLLLKHRFFRETTMEHNDYLWGNAAFAYARVAIRSFNKNAWFADMCSTALTDLVRDNYPTEPQGMNPTLATEVSITEKTQQQLKDLGFIALCDQQQQCRAIFYSNQSIQQVEEDGIEAIIASTLSYLLCVSRFAHIIKILLRNKIGSFAHAEDCQSFLRQWLLRYCAASRDATPQIRSRYPLAQADVKVEEQPTMPGSFYCIIYLTPHYHTNVQTKLKISTLV